MRSTPFVPSGRPLTAAEMPPPTESPLALARLQLRAKAQRVNDLADDLAQREREHRRAGSPPERAHQVREAQLALEKANSEAQAARDEVARLEALEADDEARRKLAGN